MISPPSTLYDPHQMFYLMHSCMLAMKPPRCTPLVTHLSHGLRWNFLQFSIHTYCIPPPVVYLWYSNYMAGSHWGVRCLSIVTHVTVNNSPLRDRARMHVGIQGHLSIGGHGPRRDWIITSITLMIDKTGIFPMAQTQSPPHLCHLSGHQHTQCLCMQSTHDLGWLTHHIIQETQKRPMLVRE